MSPFEKAEELVHKMYAGFVHDLYSYKAKQCALIAVDEIIEEVREFCDDNFINDRLHYWQRVKNEIEKL